MWRDLPWERHIEARRVVRAHPEGMTLEQIGEVLGLTRERVRQIEVTAVRKLKEFASSQGCESSENAHFRLCGGCGWRLYGEEFCECVLPEDLCELR